MTEFFLKFLTGIHLVGAGTLVSAALFLDFAVLPSFRYIPPDQATKLARAIEPKVMIVSTAALLLLALTGLIETALYGVWSQLSTAGFWSSSGYPLVVCLFVWMVLATLQTVYLFVFRPQLTQALPFDVSRTAFGVSAEVEKYTQLARLTLRAQAAIGVAAILLIAGAARMGGL